MIEIVAGFGIAFAIGLTGVGAGSITAPVLLLLLGVPAPTAVGTALVYGGIIKLAGAPSYLLRNQVNAQVLAWMCGGGLPGALIGVYLFSRYGRARTGVLLGVLGAVICVSAALNLWRLLRPRASEAPARDHRQWLPLITLPIGAEFGFSSAGAGAMGSLALMTLTSIPASQVVGTDVFFGLVLSLAGGGFQFVTGNFDGPLLVRLLAGGIPGIWIGANLSALLPPRPMRVALSLWLMSIGSQLCWHALHV